MLPTSSNGLVSLKQLSQTSLTAFSAISLDSQDGLAVTDNTALRRTHSCGSGPLPCAQVTYLMLLAEAVVSPIDFARPSTIPRQTVRADLPLSVAPPPSPPACPEPTREVRDDQIQSRTSLQA